MVHVDASDWGHERWAETQPLPSQAQVRVGVNQRIGGAALEVAVAADVDVEAWPVLAGLVPTRSAARRRRLVLPTAPARRRRGPPHDRSWTPPGQPSHRGDPHLASEARSAPTFPPTTSPSSTWESIHDPSTRIVERKGAVWSVDG
jgi:hypothetical protein